MKEPSLLAQLGQSAIYREYERAFVAATGMPLALRPVDSCRVVNHGKPSENPLCAMFAGRAPSCTACLEAQRQTADPAAHQPKSVVCFAGLSEASVPIRAGERLLGFLQTGQVIVGKTSPQQFVKTTRRLQTLGARVDQDKVQEAYRRTKVVTPKQYDSVLRLLAIFASHLGLVAHQLAIQSNHAEPACIVKARQYIHDHQEEELTLAEVSRAVNMSSFYFCKVFKKTTGLTFTEYLSQLRIERVKNKLGNRHARISEIAFESGFRSLTHFNRTFQKLLGESPSEYRATLLK